MRRILCTPDAAALAARAAALVADTLAAPRRGDHSRRRVVLAGGDTPRATYAALAQRPDAALWSQVDVVTSDERCVPPTDARSNYAMLEVTLLRPLARAGHAPRVVRLAGEEPAESAALRAEATLRELWAPPRLAEGTQGAATVTMPTLDLVVLGLGEDGHIASLLPQSEELAEEARWVVAVHEATRGTKRLSLTLPLLTDTRRLVFLVSGAAKREAVRLALTALAPSTALPSTLAAARAQETWWLLDEAAASSLPPELRQDR